MNQIAFDFSIAKPCAVVFENNNYHFYLWPKDINSKYENLFKSYDVNIIKRVNIENKDIVKYDIINSDILSDLIINSLHSFLNKDTIIAFEGSSFASHGNVTLSLTAWRYILIYKLSKIISLNNIFTFSPITIKSIAGCAKKGMGKKEMINAFIKNGPNCKLYFTLCENSNLFMKKGGKTYVDFLDDLCDAYWTLKTLIVKEKLS